MGKPTILCVDDEPLILTALQRDLDTKAHRILTAGSAAEALAILEREDVYVLLADCHMAEMSGLELMTAVRSSHPLLVRVMLTGFADTQTAIAAINDGQVYRFLEKPWQRDILRETIDRSIAQAERLRSVKKEPARAVVDRKVAALDGLENQFPGITKVERGAGGAIEIDPAEVDDAALRK
jgi:DNA-binding NtrC family response regulator